MSNIRAFIGAIAVTASITGPATVADAAAVDFHPTTVEAATDGSFDVAIADGFLSCSTCRSYNTTKYGTYSNGAMRYVNGRWVSVNQSWSSSYPASATESGRHRP